MSDAIAKIEQARAAGLPISANMYTYTAAATGLDAAMPLWVQTGGLDAWVERLRIRRCGRGSSPTSVIRRRARKTCCAWPGLPTK